jgi:Gamma interferon inducible lysosomal thiol reductase (GILT)
MSQHRMRLNCTSRSFGVGLLAAFVLVLAGVLSFSPSRSSASSSVAVQRILPHDASDADDSHDAGERAQLRVDAEQGQSDLEATSEDEQAELAQGAARVKVDAYIEMMCPDCARFVLHDLAPERFPDQLWDIVHLRLVPWVRPRAPRRLEAELSPCCHRGEFEN